MSLEVKLELYRSHRAAQERYVYFMLAAAGAAIAFAVARTQGAMLSWVQIPLALAVLCWGLSFFAGSQHLRYVESNLYANIELLKVGGGTHSKAGNHPQMIEAASSGIREAMNWNSNCTKFYARLQFNMMLTGAIFFVAWDILGMCMRTPK